MGSTKDKWLHLKCPHCGHTWDEKSTSEFDVGYKECPDCKMMVDIDKGKKFAREDWL